MSTRALAFLCAAAAAALAACAGDGGASDTCNVTVQLSPGDPAAPSTITASAEVSFTGVYQYVWTVQHDSGAVATTPATTDGSRVEFVANEPGVYTVAVTAVGCDSWDGDLNVREPGAGVHTLRLRFVPPAGAAPAQERLVTVPGGADWSAGVVTIDRGTPHVIAVRDPQGAIVPSYVRLTARATPDAIVELVTGAAGDDRATLAAGGYDVLMVPLAGDLAPRIVAGWDPLLDGTDALRVDGGQVVTGVVTGPAGAPVANARVSFAVGDDAAPSTVATTGADGRFALRWRPSEGATIAVVPPRSSGLPRLSASIDGLALAQPLAVRYAAALAAIELGGVPVRIAGVPAAGGHVTFALDRADAGTVGDGVLSRSADGRYRDTIAIDSDGELAPYRAVVSSGRAYLGAAPGDASPGAVVLVDLAAGAPAAFDGAAPVVLGGAVVGPGDAAVPGAVLRATLAGDLAHLGAAMPAAQASATGQVSLVVASGATYELEVVDPRHAHATSRRLVAASAGTLGSIALARAIEVTGEVRVTGESTGAASVAVAALCHVCAGLDRARPLDETVSDGAGTWRVVIPDPGTASP